MPVWPTQPMAAWFTSIRHAGFHRWFHYLRPAPSIGHTSTEQLSGANDGTGSARRSAHHQERTCHARKEGLRSAILRLPRRDENAQRLCSPLGDMGCRHTRLGACDWRSDADVQRGVALLTLRLSTLGSRIHSLGSTGQRCLGGTRGRGPDA